MKLVITGAHLAPAIAVIETLPKQRLSVLVIGRKHPLEGDRAVSLEYKTIQSLGVPFLSLTAGRLTRYIGTQTVRSLFKIPVGFLQAFWTLFTFRPNVVLSFGGYVSLPVVVASFFLGIPVVIHEQTFGAGIANRIASLFAKKVCISWESSRKFFPKGKTVLTGNPVRKSIEQKVQSSKFKVQSSEEKLPLIYVTGGSTGSHAINVLVEGCVEKLLQQFRIVHQTGDARAYNDFERLNNLRGKLDQTLRNRYTLVRFVAPCDVGEVMRKAALVVARAGVNTVSELIVIEKMALLIPLPYGQKKEQQTNATFLKNAGLAEVLDQHVTTSETLLRAITTMVMERETYRLKTTYTGGDGAKNIVAVVLEVQNLHAS